MSSSAPSVFDLRRNYAGYGAYHADAVNKAIHVVCVWPILFSALLLLHYLPLPLLPAAPALAAPWGGALSLNCAAVVSAVYICFYLLLEPKSGSIAAALVTACFLGSHALLHLLRPSLAWKVAVAMQVLCWIAQFVGHGVFEGRAPALLDNLVQAFLMAPLFVLLEVLHSLFSFEPGENFWVLVNKDIEVKKAYLSKHTKKL